MTRAQRMRLKLLEVLTFQRYGKRATPMCEGSECFAAENLEIDHPNGRKPTERNRSGQHRRKSALQRVRELWEAFASDEPLRVLCRSCNAREGGGRRYR